jgi:hypothetical protein
MLKEWKFMLAQGDSLLTVSLSNPPPPLLHVLLTDFNVEAEQNCQSRALKQRKSQISSSPDFNKLLSRNLLREGKSFFLQIKMEMLNLQLVCTTARGE